MTTEPTSPQPAAERRAAEAHLSGLITAYAPSHERLVAAIRRRLRKNLPTACEVVYDYTKFFVVSFSPNEHGYEGIFAIRGCEGDIRLYFQQAKGMKDPAKLLHGKANTRWIAVEGAATLEQPEVVALIDQAITKNRIPFAAEGRGAVVVRTKTAKSKRS